jgi:hypothetical protein
LERVAQNPAKNVAGNVPQKRVSDDWRQLLAVKRTMRITIETEQLLVIGRAKRVRIWCEQCAAEVEVVPIEDAAELAQVDVGTMQRALNGDQFHWSHSGESGGICLNSLLKSMNRPL